MTRPRTSGPVQATFVKVDLPREVADRLWREPKLDLIGPARWAEGELLDLLNKAHRGIGATSVDTSFVVEGGQVGQAVARVRWLSRSEGGRETPPPGPIYAATARFADDDGQLFSVVLRFQPGSGSQERRTHEAEVGFLNPSVVLSRLKRGTLLEITEGPRTVGRAKSSRYLIVKREWVSRETCCLNVTVAALGIETKAFPRRSTLAGRRKSQPNGGSSSARTRRKRRCRGRRSR